MFFILKSMFLSSMVKSDLADVADIMKQTASLCARANTVIRKFSSASLNTELLLFKAYCTPIYGCHFWCSVFQYSYRKFNIAYNDAFRQATRTSMVKVKVHTLDIAPLRSETPPQKRSDMARVLEGFHSFTCTPTRSSAIGMSHTCLCLPSCSWYSFTDPGGMEG